MERIYVTYPLAVGVGSSPSVEFGDHVAIHYVVTDDDGQVVNHRVIEAGPFNRHDDFLSRAGSTVIEETIGAFDSRSSPFGAIVVHDRPGKPRDRLYPQERVIEGEDLSSYWKAIEDNAQYVERLGFEYRPVTQNSNSFGTFASSAKGEEAGSPQQKL